MRNYNQKYKEKKLDFLKIIQSDNEDEAIINKICNYLLEFHLDINSDETDEKRLELIKLINNEEKEYKEIINNNLDDEVCSDEDFLNENNCMTFDEIFPQERKKKEKDLIMRLLDKIMT